MPHDDDQLELPDATGNEGNLAPAEPLHLRVTFNLAAGSILFEWTRGIGDEPPVVAQGRLWPGEFSLPWMVLDWQMDFDGKSRNGFCSAHASSIRALLTRIRKTLPLADELPRFGLLTNANLGLARANVFFPLLTPAGEDFWKRLGRDVLEFARILDTPLAAGGDPVARGSAGLRLLACARLGLQPDFDDLLGEGAPFAPLAKMLNMRVSFDQVRNVAEFVWSRPQDRGIVAVGRVRVTGCNQLTWDIEADGKREPSVTSDHRNSIRAALKLWLNRFPTNRDSLCALWVKPNPGGG